MKNFILLLFIITSISYSQPNLNHSLTTVWEGNQWSGNGNMGSWFPTYYNLAAFGINDYSWGEIRSINQIQSGTSINFEAQIINSSGGVNYDAAFFAIGDGWANYGGNNYGIVFRNGIVNFFEDNGSQNMTFKDTIGTYVTGEMISFTLTFNNDGTLSAQGNRFSGTFTPTSVVQNAKWIIASKDSKPNQGFYLKSIDGVSITLIENEIIELTIKDYLLSQNYPNPFNPTTMIRFSIPKQTQLKINLYNVLGELVRTLSEGLFNAGNYEVEFISQNLASGTYIYRLESDEFVISKKMILLK